MKVSLLHPFSIIILSEKDIICINTEIIGTSSRDLIDIYLIYKLILCSGIKERY